CCEDGCFQELIQFYVDLQGVQEGFSNNIEKTGAVLIVKNLSEKCFQRAIEPGRAQISYQKNEDMVFNVCNVNQRVIAVLQSSFYIRELLVFIE
ncbi:MAG: hypothetical protein EZS28_053024, partial [Streblomastix strix]